MYSCRIEILVVSIKDTLIPHFIEFIVIALFIKLIQYRNNVGKVKPICLSSREM